MPVIQLILKPVKVVYKPISSVIYLFRFATDMSDLSNKIKDLCDRLKLFQWFS